MVRIITNDNLHELKKGLSQAPFISLDTETTGLLWSSSVFLIGLRPYQGETFVVNFHPEVDIPVLTDIPGLLDALPQDGHYTAHNMMFDYTMLRKEGIRLNGFLSCTQTREMIIDNSFYVYGLDAVCRRRGIGHKDGLKEYLDAHKHYSQVANEFTGKKDKRYFFWKAPKDLLLEYLDKDVALVESLHIMQEEGLKKYFVSGKPSPLKVLENESKFIPVLYEMQETGVQVDRDFIHMAKQGLEEYLLELQAKFKDMTGLEYKAGPKQLAIILHENGIRYELSDKGNPILGKLALAKMKHPITDLVLQIRKTQHTIRNFFSSLLSFCDDKGVIHPWFKPHGTVTGRISCRDPNLMNLPKEEQGTEAENLVRQGIVPREGYCLVMIDYKQQEYRLMLDYAGEMGLLERVMGGEDVHSATAEAVGNISRQHAKKTNFALLYGIGVMSLSEMLGMSVAATKELKARYFNKLIHICNFIHNVKSTVQTRGYVHNWMGRPYRGDFTTSYKIPNHIIQGGCGDVMKVAMVRIHEYLKGKRTRMILQIHDELIFEVPKEELTLIPEIQKIMETVYPARNGIVLETSVEHSWKSWGSAHKKAGYPDILTE